MLYILITMATIYRIYSDKGDLQYYGSTIQKLSKRFNQHTEAYRNYLKNLKGKSYSSYTSRLLFIEYGVENCSIEGLEECLPENRNEREEWYIKNNTCVNIVNPAKRWNQQQYTEENKEKLKIYNKEWNEKNREKQILKKKQYYENNKDKWTLKCSTMF